MAHVHIREQAPHMYLYSFFKSIWPHSSNVFVLIPQMYLTSFLKCICPHSSKVFSAKHQHSGCAHPAYAVQARVEDYHHDDVDDDVDNDIHNYDDVDNGV